MAVVYDPITKQNVRVNPMKNEAGNYPNKARINRHVKAEQRRQLKANMALAEMAVRTMCYGEYPKHTVQVLAGLVMTPKADRNYPPFKGHYKNDVEKAAALYDTLKVASTSFVSCWEAGMQDGEKGLREENELNDIASSYTIPHAFKQGHFHIINIRKPV